MHSQSNKARKHADQQAIFKLNPIAAACAAAFLLASTNSFAQQADAATTTEEQAIAAKKKKEGEAVELDAVKVTGIRRGIANSIEKKKEATSIVEVISAEDIGKLPDASIADALSRVSGLTAQRVAGRASDINIRGFASDFSTTLLNGREQVSVGDNRGVQYDQYPSELIGGVTIYKTPDAKLIGQGLSGTVDLQTLKPLSYRERSISLNARFEQNSLGEINPGYTDQGNRVSATYIDQFADDTFGIALGFARLDSPGQNERWRSWGYPTGTVNGQPNTFLLGGSQLYASSTEQVRTGMMAVLEYKPNSDFHSVMDIFYSKFDKTETTRGLEVGLAWGAGTPSNLVVSNGFVVGGTYTGAVPVLRNDLNTSDDSIFSIGWNNKLRLNEDWTATLDVSGSNAKRNDRYLEIYAGAVNAADTPVSDTISFVIDPNTGLPTFRFGLNYNDPSLIRLTDSSGWGQSGFVKSPQIRDDQVALRANFKRDFLEGAFSSIEFGFNYSDRNKSRASKEFFLDLLTSPTAIPAGFLQPGAPLNLTGGTPVIGFDIDGVFNSGLYSLRSLTNADVLNKNWDVNEQLKTFYTQLNIDTNLGSVPVRGNVGIQYQMAYQSASGFNISSAVAVPYTRDASYNDFLPSLNLSFELAHQQIIRFGAAKTLARPRMDYLSGNISANCTTGGAAPVGQCIWSGGGGNAELEPTRADAYDLAYEKYFDTPGAFIGLAYYFKGLKTFDYRAINRNFDFSGFVAPPGVTPVSNIGTFEQRLNGTGGYVRGLEFNASIPFSLFSDTLDGFGVTLNAAHIESSIPGEGPGTVTPFPQLSTDSHSITAYYEKHGFSARISQRFRDDFYGETRDVIGADLGRVYIDDETITDLQLGYNFAEGSRFEGLSILLQANNLTNERYAQYNLTATGVKLPQLYGEYGRTVLLGLNYKF